MRRGTDRILTTHTGSLPRTPHLATLVRAKAAGGDVDRPALDTLVMRSVAEVVAQQCGVGVDVINDGEQGKVAYAIYVKDRLSGFEDWDAPKPAARRDDFPEYTERMAREQRTIVSSDIKLPVCTGPIAYTNVAAIQTDLDNLKNALTAVSPTDVFMSAASPGVIAHFCKNQHYRGEEEYVYALADAMKLEYDAIFRAGFVLQVDCPDLTMSGWERLNFSRSDLNRKRELHVEALNHAVRDIPPEQLRMHLCWGNYEGPHHLDTPLDSIIGHAFRARPSAISFEAANPRHAHEWKLFEQIKLPEGKLIIPGVLDSTTNFIEHPELVQQRIVQYAKLVGRENVIAGTDCGFAHFATTDPKVDPRIAWAKLSAMAEGARLASTELW